MRRRSRLPTGVAVLVAGALVAASACSGAATDGPSATAEASAPTEQATRSPSLPGEKATIVVMGQAELDRRLIAAAWDNDVPAARALIDAGADVNAQDPTRQSAYLIATSEGHLRLLDLTFRNGADVRSLDSYRGTGLIRAAERGHADVVGRLLQEDIAVNHVNRLGWTALHEAIILGDGSPRYVDTVRLLVAGSADVGLPSRRDGVPPIDHALSRGLTDIAQVLRAADRPEQMSRAQADERLLRAARRGDPDGAALALRAGADLEARDARRRTPLLLAAIHDRVAVARLLVMLGADPDALDVQHDSAWLVTGVTGSVAMLETLLPAGPDLTLRNRYGGVSVIPASERGHVDYVRRVVRTGIDVNHVNDLGWTALLEAIILGDGSRPYRQIVRALLAAGARPDLADGDGVTPLSHAERRGQRQIAQQLRAAG
jgi:uncharacterized protein